jgi:HSP20 family protein
MLAVPRSFCRSFLDPLFNLSPFTDILTTKAGYQIQLELPGVKKEDIAIELEKGALKVTATRKAIEPEGTKRVHAEREFGELTRAFRLPESAQLDKLEAVLSDGVLTVSIPKKEIPKIQIKIQ